MTTVLLTGFEPFAGEARNPSSEAVEEVARRWDAGDAPARLVTATLPVAFDHAGARLRTLIDEHAADVVIATGLAGGRAHLTPERVAVNLRDARIPDNAGAQPLDRAVVDEGPAAYFSTLPVKAVVEALTAARLPAALSHTAGTFVCNDVFYTALHTTAHRPGARAGFVHVPWSTQTAPPGAPSLPAEDIAHGLDIVIRTTLRIGDDLAVPGGALH